VVGIGTIEKLIRQGLVKLLREPDNVFLSLLVHRIRIETQPGSSFREGSFLSVCLPQSLPLLGKRRIINLRALQAVNYQIYKMS